MKQSEIQKHLKYNGKLSPQEKMELVMIWGGCIFFGLLMGFAFIGLIMTQGTY